MYLSDLVKKNILAIGQNAKGNPQTLELPHFAAGVANKDYPAQTPRLWNYVYQKLGMDQRNIRLFGDPVNLETIVEALRQDPLYIGGDIGVGFKDKAWRLLDEVEPLARAMQSINVIVKRGNKLLGYNTDGQGYVDSLVDLLRQRGDKLVDKLKLLTGKHILLLAAGATNSSIAFALADAGARLVILNRTESKALDLANRIVDRFGVLTAIAGGRELIPRIVDEVDVVISAIDEPSSLLYKYSALGQIVLPATEENIARNLEEARQLMAQMRPRAVISDVMLRDEDTATIRQAKKMGFTTLNGKPMVRNQAVEAFWLVNQEQLERRGITHDQVAELILEASQS